MIEAYDDMQPKQSLTCERLSSPLSLLYALQTLPGRCIGSVDDRPTEDLSSLTVHRVKSSLLGEYHTPSAKAKEVTLGVHHAKQTIQ